MGMECKPAVFSFPTAEFWHSMSLEWKVGFQKMNNTFRSEVNGQILAWYIFYHRDAK